ANNIMADEKFNEDDKNLKKGDNNFRVPPRTWVVWIAIIGSILTLVLVKSKIDPPGKLLSQPDFMDKVKNHLIVPGGKINYNPQSPLVDVSGYFYNVDAEGHVLKDSKTEFRAKVRLTEFMENKLFASGLFEPKESSQLFLGVLLSVLPFVLI